MSSSACLNIVLLKVESVKCSHRVYASYFVTVVEIKAIMFWGPSTKVGRKLKNRKLYTSIKYYLENVNTVHEINPYFVPDGDKKIENH